MESQRIPAARDKKLCCLVAGGICEDCSEELLKALKEILRNHGETNQPSC